VPGHQEGSQVGVVGDCGRLRVLARRDIERISHARAVVVDEAAPDGAAEAPHRKIELAAGAVGNVGVLAAYCAGWGAGQPNGCVSGPSHTWMNVARQVLAELTCTVAVGLVRNANPASGVAVSVTGVGSVKVTWHAVPPVPQVNPPPVTVPPEGTGVIVSLGTTVPPPPPRSTPVMSCVHRLENDAAVPISQLGVCALAAIRGL